MLFKPVLFSVLLPIQVLAYLDNGAPEPERAALVHTTMTKPVSAAYLCNQQHIELSRLSFMLPISVVCNFGLSTAQTPCFHTQPTACRDEKGLNCFALC